MSEAVLHLKDVQAWYGESQILHGVNLEAGRGELVALLGRNGAGKSTTFRSVMGLMPKLSGSVSFDGREISRLMPHRIARAGIGFCPEHRGIFGKLTVAENLTLPPGKSRGEFDLERIFDLFPNLKTRLNSRGGRLSGGEQQMLAIARILLNGSRLLLLDEPTEGLAPVIIDMIEDAIVGLKKAHLTIVLIEQNLDFALSVADRIYVMEAGRIVAAYSGEEARGESSRISRLLGV